jgi:hypothetical protein
MTTKQLRAAAAATTLALALGASGVAQAAVSGVQQPVHYTMQTSLRDLQHPGEYPGNLSLMVYPSGIVNGFYVPQDGQPHDVVGGLDGHNIWLDIGTIEMMDFGVLNSLHLTGTLKEGVLNTTAAVPGPDTVVFESTNSVHTNS